MTEAVDPKILAAIMLSFALGPTILVLVPIARILKRTGHEPAWCLLFVHPIANVVALWTFAFKRWPIDNKPNI